MKVYRISHNTINETWTCSVDVLKNGKPFTISTNSKRQYREKLTTLESRLFNKLLETIKEKGYTLIEPKGVK